MILSDPRLTIQCNERWRPRAEQCLGWVTLAPEIFRRLNAIECIGEEAIDDGILGQAVFTKAHYRAIRDLFNSIASLAANTTLMNALYTMQVRSIGVITPILPDPQAGLGSLESNLKYIIRVVAPKIRALRRMIEDDSRITPVLTASYDDVDVIDDGRSAENLQNIPIWAVRAMHNLLEELTGPTMNTNILADAIDAACLNPLRCE